MEIYNIKRVKETERAIKISFFDINNKMQIEAWFPKSIISLQGNYASVNNNIYYQKVNEFINSKK